MKVLVTGHQGFIGSHFYKYFTDLGHEVMGVDVKLPHPIDALDLFRGNGPHFDLTIHAAASIPSAEDRSKNPMPVALNLALDALYFQWMMRTRPTQALYFSSSAVYPVRLNVPGHALDEDDIDLDHIENADSMYGFTKLVGEVQVQEAQRQGQHVLVVRPQSGYGHDQSPNYPFRAILALSAGKILSWGTGTQARDFIHVDDVVHATVEMLKDYKSGPFNLGTGRATTMRELAELMVKAVPGYNPTIVCDETKPDGAPYRYASVERMHDVYRHKITLEEGIDRALGSVW